MTKRNGLLVALVASLLVNALIIGSWLGQRWHRDPVVSSMSWHILKRSPESLPEEAQAVLREERGKLRQGFRAMRRSHHRVAELLAQEPLDTVALAVALAEVRESGAVLKRQSHEVLLQILPMMPASERLAMLRHHKRGQKGQHRRCDVQPPEPPPGA